MYLKYNDPAVYEIKVQGDLMANWSDRLGGLQILVERPEGATPVSILIGQLQDQAALSGVLRSLYELHLPLISVKLLETTD